MNPAAMPPGATIPPEIGKFDTISAKQQLTYFRNKQQYWLIKALMEKRYLESKNIIVTDATQSAEIANALEAIKSEIEDRQKWIRFCDEMIEEAEKNPDFHLQPLASPSVKK